MNDSIQIQWIGNSDDHVRTVEVCRYTRNILQAKIVNCRSLENSLWSELYSDRPKTHTNWSCSKAINKFLNWRSCTVGRYFRPRQIATSHCYHYLLLLLLQKPLQLWPTLLLSYIINHSALNLSLINNTLRRCLFEDNEPILQHEIINILISMNINKMWLCEFVILS